MSSKEYWLILFNSVTWQEFVNSGSEIMGFKSHRRKSVEKLKIGDYLLCYITGLGRFIGVLEVKSPLFLDDSQIWQDDMFSCRVKVSPIITLSLETALPVLELREQLSIFKEIRFPSKWGVYFQTSLAKWKPDDGKLTVEALHKASKNPINRSFDPTKLIRPAKRVDYYNGVRLTTSKELPHETKKTQRK